MFELILSIIALCFFPLLLWMIIASIGVRSTYNKYSQIPAENGMTAHLAARTILDKNGLINVQISTCPGTLTDHYDPRSNTVYLSEATYYSPSIAAIGVAAHEVGHAIQYAEEYAPVKMRTALVPVVNFTSRMIMPLMLLGLVFELLAYTVSFNISAIFFMAALVCYAFYALFTFITLPCEYNASKRARVQLEECGILSGEETAMAKKVLDSAAKTYLVAFMMSLVQVARILLLLLGTRRRR